MLVGAVLFIATGIVALIHFDVRKNVGILTNT